MPFFVILILFGFMSTKNFFESEFSITNQNGTDTIKNVEYIQFTDSTISTSSIGLSKIDEIKQLQELGYSTFNSQRNFTDLYKDNLSGDIYFTEANNS